MKNTAKRILRGINGYTKWAFNPQAELTTRYERVL